MSGVGGIAHSNAGQGTSGSGLRQRDSAFRTLSAGGGGRRSGQAGAAVVRCELCDRMRAGRTDAANSRRRNAQNGRAPRRGALPRAAAPPVAPCPGAQLTPSRQPPRGAHLAPISDSVPPPPPSGVWRLGLFRRARNACVVPMRLFVSPHVGCGTGACIQLARRSPCWCDRRGLVARALAAWRRNRRPAIAGAGPGAGAGAGLAHGPWPMAHLP